MTELGKRASKTRFEQAMRADPPLWVAEQDAQAEAEDVEHLMNEDAKEDSEHDYTAVHRRNSAALDQRAERIRQKMEQAR